VTAPDRDKWNNIRRLSSSPLTFVGRTSGAPQHFFKRAISEETALVFAIVLFNVILISPLCGEFLRLGGKRRRFYRDVSLLGTNKKWLIIARFHLIPLKLLPSRSLRSKTIKISREIAPTQFNRDGLAPTKTNSEYFSRSDQYAYWILVDFRAGRDLYLAVIALRYLYTTLSRQNGRTNCTTSIKLNNLLPCAGSQRKRPNRVRVCDSKYVLPIQGPMELSSGIAPAATGRDEPIFGGELLAWSGVEVSDEERFGRCSLDKQKWRTASRRNFQEVGPPVVAVKFPVDNIVIIMARV
jgi:hypothetical protein